MHPRDVLFYGNRTVQMTLAGIPTSEWETPNVCGWWSVKQIVAHLASHELVLAEVLQALITPGPTPTLDRFQADQGAFNDPEVARRDSHTPMQTLAEYEMYHTQVMELFPRLPSGKSCESGVLPWYGEEYDLEDWIAYGFYGHKREHCSQINVFRDRLVELGVVSSGREG